MIRRPGRNLFRLDPRPCRKDREGAGVSPVFAAGDPALINAGLLELDGGFVDLRRGGAGLPVFLIFMRTK